MGYISSLFDIGGVAASKKTGTSMLNKFAAASKGFSPSGGSIQPMSGMGSRSSAVNSAVGMSGTYGRAGKSARQAGKMVDPNTGLSMR